MLFFSISHWCVFPAEEWEDGYKEQFYQGPGFAFRDFTSDVSLIIDSGKQSIRARREMKKNGSLDGSRSTADGLSFSGKTCAPTTLQRGLIVIKLKVIVYGKSVFILRRNYFCICTSSSLGPPLDSYYRTKLMNWNQHGNGFVVMNKLPQISDCVGRELIQHQKLYNQISNQLQYNNKTHLNDY
jgi:hypothetical protein